MKTFLLTIMLSLLTNFSFGQSDTLFMDNDFKKCPRKDAKYYRLVTTFGTSFIVKDFYINNIPQMIAECSSADPFIRNGISTTYDEKGIRQARGAYDHEKGVGIWTLWEDGGKDSTVFEFKADGSMYYINKGHFDEIRGKKQFVIVEGKGSPTVVFITGKGREQNDFTKVFTAIKKNTQIFAYDRAGLGQSESLDNERTIDTMAYELNELLMKEKIKPPFILVGHSMGGWIIRCFTKMYPKKVAGLIFIDSACELDYKKGMEIRNDSDKVKFTAQYKAYLNVPTRTKGQNAESTYTFDFDKNNYSTNSNIVKDIKIPNNIPITVFLSTQIDNTDPYGKQAVKIRQDFFESWKKQNSKLKLVVTSNSGHFIHFQEPDLIIGGITEMIKQIK